MDGHERPAQRFARKQFSKRYLTEIEPRCYRWIQISDDDLIAYRNDNKIPKDLHSDHEYELEDRTKMHEFHVDSCRFLQDLADKHPQTGKFGGCMSVRANNLKPIMILGQDECVFHQFSLVSKQWVGAEGQRALMPKSEGAGLMVSAFQSRELGLLYDIPERIMNDK